jgi:(4S)-4-hydroxy-5-phosphonooxypentane-2,3-dione isomerase
MLDAGILARTPDACAVPSPEEVPPMHVTLVHVHVLPEHVADFIAATGPNHAGAVAEPGCLRFDVLQAPDEPTRFVLYEAYLDADAAAAHKETAHYQAWKSAVASWMAEPRRGEPFTGLLPVFP